MNLDLQYKIKSNYNYVKFLRENSYWYRYLNRTPNYFASFDKDMKTKYRLTTSDKLEKFSKNINKISQLIDIFS